MEFPQFLFTAVISRRALQGIGENGFFGVGKSKRLEKLNFGASDKTWTYIDTISTALWAVTLVARCH